MCGFLKRAGFGVKVGVRGDFCGGTVIDYHPFVLPPAAIQSLRKIGKGSAKAAGFRFWGDSTLECAKTLTINMLDTNSRQRSGKIAQRGAYWPEIRFGQLVFALYSFSVLLNDRSYAIALCISNMLF